VTSSSSSSSAASSASSSSSSSAPRFVDIGANLTNKAFRADREAVLLRAADAGVAGIVITGTSAAASRAAWAIAADHRGAEVRESAAATSGIAGPIAASAGTRAPRLYATAGVHPHQASTLSPETLAELRALLVERPEVVAVGECGLDYNRDFSPRDVQRRCFDAQLEMAADLGKPVFLHERDAAEDFTAALTRWRPRLAGGVVHCFTGDRAALERYIALDLYIGITGWICDERRGTHLRELVKRVPRGRLLVETDAPYILPRDLPRRPRDGRNEPAFVAHVARVVAEHRGESVEDLARHTTDAARALFGIEV
jgi:TatD DNase family protein